MLGAAGRRADDDNQTKPTDAPRATTLEFGDIHEVTYLPYPAHVVQSIHRCRLMIMLPTHFPELFYHFTHSLSTNLSLYSPTCLLHLKNQHTREDDETSNSSFAFFQPDEDPTRTRRLTGVPTPSPDCGTRSSSNK